ncbi:MAG: YciI family protein [Myxococcales bacterium]|nr:YciI family protein [Myxococcales bacterium]
MQYMALIYDSETQRNAMSPEDRKQYLADFGAFTRAVKDAGVFVAGDALTPVDTATTVRIREGRTLMIDGPFAETKEQLGGYYLLECKDLDEAVHWASQIPTAKYGSIEVRPIMVW